MGDEEKSINKLSNGEAVLDSDEPQCQVSIEIDQDADDDDNDIEGITAAAALREPEPPEIPSFLENIRVEQITPEIRTRLRYLDLNTTSLKNWEWLASNLGMSAEDIAYIRERVIYPASPTLEVLRLNGQKSLGHVLRIIRDKLMRYDVIIQLLPSLISFEEHLRTCKSNQEAATAGADGAAAIQSKNDTSMSTVDSGIVGESCQATSMGLSGAISQSLAGQSGPSNGQFTILITFSEEENPQHKKVVVWLAQHFEKAGAQVIMDDSLATRAADDWTSRVSGCFTKARWIVIVCSPQYIRCTDSSSDENAAQIDFHSQCTRFIYQLMCAEYRQNNCRNRRFRPIIFEKTATSVNEVVPPILRSTIIHYWPSQHKELMKFLFDDQPQAAS